MKSHPPVLAVLGQPGPTRDFIASLDLLCPENGAIGLLPARAQVPHIFLSTCHALAYSGHKARHRVHSQPKPLPSQFSSLPPAPALGLLYQLAFSEGEEGPQNLWGCLHPGVLGIATWLILEDPQGRGPEPFSCLLPETSPGPQESPWV